MGERRLQSVDVARLRVAVHVDGGQGAGAQQVRQRLRQIVLSRVRWAGQQKRGRGSPARLPQALDDDGDGMRLAGHAVGQAQVKFVGQCDHGCTPRVSRRIE